MRRRILPGRLRDLVDELDDPDLLVARDVAGHVRLELLGGPRRRVGHDEGLGQLARLVVGHADDRDVGDLRVGDEQRLELGRRHLEALVLDELLDAVDDRDTWPCSSTTAMSPVWSQPSSSMVLRVASSLLR
jgi:hypothetical protein